MVFYGIANFDTVNKIIVYKVMTFFSNDFVFGSLSWTENRVLLCFSTSVGVKQEDAPLTLR